MKSKHSLTISLDPLNYLMLGRYKIDKLQANGYHVYHIPWNYDEMQIIDRGSVIIFICESFRIRNNSYRQTSDLDRVYVRKESILEIVYQYSFRHITLINRRAF